MGTTKGLLEHRLAMVMAWHELCSLDMDVGLLFGLYLPPESARDA
jgi:hypothetical protein